MVITIGNLRGVIVKAVAEKFWDFGLESPCKLANIVQGEQVAKDRRDICTSQSR